MGGLYSLMQKLNFGFFGYIEYNFGFYVEPKWFCQLFLDTWPYSRVYSELNFQQFDF